MRTNKRLSNVVVAAAVCLLVLASTVAGAGGAAPRAAYTVTDLGTLGGANSQAYAINAQGEIAGWAETGAVAADGTPIRWAFHWKGGVMRGLGTLGGEHSAAFGLNDRGWVVGTANRVAGGRAAVLWKAGDIVDLGTWRQDHFTSDIGSTTANAVNARGQIAGWAVPEATGDKKAVVFHRGRMHFPRQFVEGAAEAINKGGVVAGWSSDPGEGPFSYVWPGKRTLLGPRSRGDYYETWDKAYGINDRRLVVGTSERGAYLWRWGLITWLGMLPGHSFSRANDVNNRGRIVGVSGVEDWYGGRDYTQGRAFLWERGRVFDLNKLIAPGTAWELEEARAINDRGQIVGWGFPSGRAAGVRHAFLLTPR